MNKTYIDIGINLTNKQFQNDTETIIQNAIVAEVFKMILTGTSIRNSEQSAVLAKKYPNVLYAAVATVAEFKRILVEKVAEETMLNAKLFFEL